MQGYGFKSLGFSLLAASALLAGCSAQSRAAFGRAYDSSFQKSFKTSFVSSCETRLPTAKPGVAKTYCGCAETGIEKHLSNAEMIAFATGAATESSKARVSAVMQQCAAKALTLQR